MPRHSVCSFIVIWCNKCWSQFTKHLYQFATQFGLVLRHYCCIKNPTLNHKSISCFTSLRYMIILPAIFWTASSHFFSNVQGTIFIIKRKLSRALSGKATGAGRWWSILSALWTVFIGAVEPFNGFLNDLLRCLRLLKAVYNLCSHLWSSS